MKISNPGDFAIGAAFMAAGAGIAAIASGHETLPGTVVGPGLFPLITGAGTLLFGGVLALQAWRAPGTDEPRAAPGEAEPGGPPLLNGFALGVLAIIVLAALFMRPLGFVVTGMLLSAGVILLSGGRWMAALIFSPVATLLLFYLFVHAFGVPLPRGILG